MPSYIEDEEGRKNADPEHGSPGEGRRQVREENGITEGGDGPTEGPARLYGPDRAAAIPRLDGLAHQHGPDRPFAAESEPLQAANDEQLRKRTGKAAEKCEDGEPDNGELQNFHPAIAIGTLSPPAIRRARRAREPMCPTGQLARA